MLPMSINNFLISEEYDIYKLKLMWTLNSNLACRTKQFKPSKFLLQSPSDFQKYFKHAQEIIHTKVDSNGAFVYLAVFTVQTSIISLFYNGNTQSKDLRILLKMYYLPD